MVRSFNPANRRRHPGHVGESKASTRTCLAAPLNAPTNGSKRSSRCGKNFDAGADALGAADAAAGGAGLSRLQPSASAHATTAITRPRRATLIGGTFRHSPAARKLATLAAHD